MKRSPLRRRTPLRRSRGFRPDPERARAWRILIALGKQCVVCDTKSFVDPHHIIEQQILRRKAKERGLDPNDLLFDPAVGIPICRDCHERHHLASKRIPYSALPQAALDFAEALGLTWLIEQRYPREGPHDV